MNTSIIPVIDLFAGPGGLSEGFSTFTDSRGNRRFEVMVSIEKDLKAYETLRLRAFFNTFPQGAAPDCYYDYIRGSIPKDDLWSGREASEHWQHAGRVTHHATLGDHCPTEVDSWIADAIRGADPWVLIGGPPCQAYSIAGRARMRNGDPDAFELDHRHFLYKEYLRIIREFRPAVFVMENVKGMLSSRHGGTRIFERIQTDLKSPQAGLEYELRSFIRNEIPTNPNDFVIESERYGIPQARHRVIIFGIRSDLSSGMHRVLEEKETLTVRDMLSGMPPVRSRLSLRSKPKDSFENWLSALRKTPEGLSGWHDTHKGDIVELINLGIQLAEYVELPGSKFIRDEASSGKDEMPHTLQWTLDPKLGGTCQHETRSHMPTDLNRYMFAACYAEIYKVSPKLGQFPLALLPEHRNVDGSVSTSEVPFEDRFRVQRWGAPSTTVLSHMAKDGHYFIHPDPSQCRSLTVREAARLQTFPDNYYFEGNKIDQYTQVGNAVPPYLAKQIAEIVADFLTGADRQSVDHRLLRSLEYPESLAVL